MSTCVSTFPACHQLVPIRVTSSQNCQQGTTSGAEIKEITKEGRYCPREIKHKSHPSRDEIEVQHPASRPRTSVRTSRCERCSLQISVTCLGRGNNKRFRRIPPKRAVQTAISRRHSLTPTSFSAQTNKYRRRKRSTSRNRRKTYRCRRRTGTREAGVGERAGSARPSGNLVAGRPRRSRDSHSLLGGWRRN